MAKKPIRKDPNFGPAIEQADKSFRRGFAVLLSAGMKARMHKSGQRGYEEVNDQIMARLPQGHRGNPGAVRDASKGSGWINDEYATELLRYLVPEVEELPTTYRDLKAAVDGKTEPTYRPGKK